MAVRLTGKLLAERWKVDVRHALFSTKGDWYHQLEDFPGALFDPDGFVRFETKEEFKSCQWLRIKKDVNVRNIKSIRNIPGYIRVTTSTAQGNPGKKRNDHSRRKLTPELKGPSFEKDRIYNRRTEIHGQYGGQRQGGISTPTEVPAIFLFTGETGEQYGYRDGPDESGVFLYTGEGQLGDMEFVRGNLSIRDHSKNGCSLHLFLALGKSKGYRYLGEYVCANYENRTAPDRNGNHRRVIVFHLLPCDDGNSNDSSDDGSSKAHHRSARSLEEARKRAYAAMGTNEGAAGREARRIYYQRNRDVRDYVLLRADGKCESCKKAAPFNRKDGSAYLEPHHTTRLSDAGLDHPKYVGAICPTCHREIHYGVNGNARNTKLIAYLTDLEEEFE